MYLESADNYAPHWEWRSDGNIYYQLAYRGWKCKLIKKYSQCEFPIIKNSIVVPWETAQKVKYVIN